MRTFAWVRILVRVEVRELTIDLEMKKNVLKNEYSIVIMIAFESGLPLTII